MNRHVELSPPRRLGALEPLRERSFRTIWTSSLFSNFGVMILGVGAAWEMTRLTSSPARVALIQTALMLPMMLVSVPAGALADMFDRRKVAITGLGFAFACASTLALLTNAGYVTQWLLLAFCTLIGSGTSIYGPAWQASVREQVPPDQLPAAVALASVSYNIARSFGPAIGGMIVLLAGARVAFAVNAACYLPLIVAFFLWKRPIAPARLPPERIDRAIVIGARYAILSQPIRTVMLRAFLTGMAMASISALTPVLARDVLHGGAGVYGLLLGGFGGGSVSGAMLIGHVRARMKAEGTMRLCATLFGAAVIVIAFSRSIPLTFVALAVAGANWMLLAAMLNLGVQLSAPRWVTARALSWYQSSLTGGIALGAWTWGSLASAHGVSIAMLASGLAMMATPLVGLLLPMPRVLASEIEPVDLQHEPRVALALTARSGPIAIEIDYRVDPDDARNFYNAMRRLQRVRSRNGGFGWSLSRDIADPWSWTERYTCPTWGDYLQARSRLTQGDLALQNLVASFCNAGANRTIRRKLERPFGSVRWRGDSPEAPDMTIPVYAP